MTQLSEAGAPAAARTATPAGPLSFFQQRLWFLDRIDPTGVEYLVPTVLRLVGGLDSGALRSAIDDLLRRHGILRARVALRDGGPVQIFDVDAPCDLAVTDLRTRPTLLREPAALELVRQIAGRPIDLASGPMLRADLLRLDEDTWWLVLVVHHMAFDAGSREILFRELGAAYSHHLGLREGLPLMAEGSYVDVALAERARLQRGGFDEGVSYWKRRLSGTSPLDLAEQSRPALRDARGALETADLPQRLCQNVASLARRSSMTPYMVYLAAFAVLLARHAGRSDVVIGTPHDRRDPQWANVVGPFLNLLPIRLEVLDELSVGEFLGHVRAAVAEALRYGDVPFDHLVDALVMERDLSRTPLVQTMFVMERPGICPLLPGIEVDEIEFDRGIAKFDCTLAVRDVPGRSVAAMQYATSLFSSARMRAMLAQYRHLLTQIERGTATKVGDLDPLAPEERRALAVASSGTPVPESQDERLEGLADAQVARTPDAVAVAGEDGEFTFAALDAQAESVAALLRRHGVGPETVVGIHLERSVDLIVAVLGVLKAGGAWLPLAPDLPAERLRFMRQDSRARLLVTCRRLANSVASVRYGAEAVCMEDSRTLSTPRPRPADRRRPDQLAYVIYTSGSTGTPKGVAVEHRSVANRLVWMQRQYGIGPGDVILHKTPFTFDVSVWELLLGAISGARTVVLPPGAQNEPATIARTIAQNRVTTLHFVPSMLRAFLASNPEPGELRSIRRVICSGEELPADLAERWNAVVPACEIHNLYGPTEATVDVTAHQYEPQDVDRVPIGRPVTRTQVYVVDRVARLLPIGAPGELLIGGIQVARGYIGRAALTAERFIPDPFGGTPGARLYRTGDLARFRSDGEVEFLGRIDRQVKIRGVRIEPAEIEAALVAHPLLSAAAVRSRPGPDQGPELVAYVVPREGVPFDAPGLGRDALMTHLARWLPAAMLPSAFVTLPRLPLTATGKLDQSALPEPPRTSTAAPVPPRSRVEAVLAEIWRDVLGVDRVGITDDFFELGGNSLSAVVVAVRIREELQRSLPVGMLMERPTIAQLAGAVGDESSLRSHGSLVPLRPRGRGRPVFFVHSHGGHVFVYQQASHYIPRDRPVYALRARGLDEGTIPFERIEDMAAYYVRLMRQVQPRGPYAIAGWCLGGAVALEMAQQVSRIGERVDPLGIISLSAVQEMPDWEANDDAAFLGFVLAGFMPDARDHAGLAGHANVPLDLERMRSMALDDQLRYVMDLARSRRLLRADVDTPEEAKRLFAVYSAHRRAILKYQLRPYDGRIVLFKAERNHLPDSPSGDLGWGELARGGLTIRHVPGNHFQILQEPSVRVFAHALEERLRAGEQGIEGRSATTAEA